MESKIFYFVMVLSVLCACKGSQTNEYGQEGVEQNSVTFTIDFNDRKQTIHGFGASDAWSIQFVGRNWPLEKREQIADLLFSLEMDSEGNPKGIGLSIWRFNIGAGSAGQGGESGIKDSWRRAESFLTADSTYDWDKQQGQQWFVKAAHRRGVDTFIGFVNSPPVLLTKNGKAYGDGSAEANLPLANYEKFADYLARIAHYFKEQGTPFTYISPVNEPHWNWSRNNGQEGSPYQNAEISVLAEILDRKIREYDLDSKVGIPEAARIDFLYGGDLPGRNNQIEHFFGSDSHIKQLSAVARKIAGHSYFTTWPVDEMIEQRRRVKESVQNAAVPIEYWMTEYCILAHNEEIRGGGRDLGMDPALYVARVLHYDMTIAGAVSWQWWLAVSPYDYKDGLIYIDKNTQNGKADDSKLLWGLGNYSRFIRPGAVQLGVNRSDRATPEEAAVQLMVSSYYHEEQKAATVVLINYEYNDREVRAIFENSPGSVSEFTPYLTSKEADLEKQGSIKRGELFIMPARSIMTLQADIER